MVQTILLIVLVFSPVARADFFGFGSGGSDKYQSRIPGLAEKVRSLKPVADPAYEDEFNKSIQALENAIEEEKLFCSGEAQDDKGRVLAKEQKQLCFRDLKNKYLEAVKVIFEAKKKYLSVLHNRQMERLSDVQKQQELEIEKSF